MTVRKNRIYHGSDMKIIGWCLLVGSLVSGTVYAGAVDGPLTHRDTINPYDSDRYSIVFERERRARIDIVGDSSSDIDCYVYDSEGNLIDQDSDFTDHCILSWTPRWTGKYSVVIKNRGSKYNEYRLRTN